MKKSITFTIASLLVLIISGQNIGLIFTAVDNESYIQLDSIKVMNRTQDCDTVLFWPDTVLFLGGSAGLQEVNIEKHDLHVFQNYPNPVAGQTTISLYIPEKDIVNIIVTDILGRTIVQNERILDKGTHTFRFTPGNGNLYITTAFWQGNASSIKMVCMSKCSTGGTVKLDYSGVVASTLEFKSKTSTQDFVFNPGDELLYIGYKDTLESGILDAPEESSTYTFQFAYNIPCPGTPTVEYEGQVYNTIQIFSQCWFKENLNVGMMIPGEQEMAYNDTIEKYCYVNEPDSCTKYGGLYQWGEMMKYAYQQGVQGICPPGWHLPMDEEWKVLEGAVDSQYGIGDPEWDLYLDTRGTDAGTNLKTTSGWYANGNGTDLFGFSGLPGGYRFAAGYLTGIGHFGYWWTSTRNYIHYGRWGRGLSCHYPGVSRYDGHQGNGNSVRCLRDD